MNTVSIFACRIIKDSKVYISYQEVSATTETFVKPNTPPGINTFTLGILAMSRNVTMTYFLIYINHWCSESRYSIIESCIQYTEYRKLYKKFYIWHWLLIWFWWKRKIVTLQGLTKLFIWPWIIPFVILMKYFHFSPISFFITKAPNTAQEPTGCFKSFNSQNL